VKQSWGRLVAKETIGPAWWRLKIAIPALLSPARPGQFFLCRCGDELLPAYLRRVIFPAQSEAGQMTCLLTPSADPGLAWLLARNEGDRLDLIGPLGQGMSLAQGVRHLLLVGEGQAIGPLLALLEQALPQGLAVTLALGAGRAAALYPRSALPLPVELQAATLDGSMGHRGAITDLTPPLLTWADVVLAVGSPRLYRVLAGQVAEVRLGPKENFLYGLLSDYPLACGVGACLSCAVETGSGLQLACLDGPIFDLMRLDAER
jgi:dihydroorotate dehydrogenase electron transfer subunit